jgi:chaperonin GroES
MKVIPIGDKVVVQRVEAEDKTAGGIMLPEAARTQPAEGRILSIGDGIRCAHGACARFQVNEGDRVLFSSYAGTEIEVDGTELLVLSEADILAVIS